MHYLFLDETMPHRGLIQWYVNACYCQLLLACWCVAVSFFETLFRWWCVCELYYHKFQRVGLRNLIWKRWYKYKSLLSEPTNWCIFKLFSWYVSEILFATENIEIFGTSWHFFLLISGSSCNMRNSRYVNANSSDCVYLLRLITQQY